MKHLVSFIITASLYLSSPETRHPVVIHGKVYAAFRINPDGPLFCYVDGQEYIYAGYYEEWQLSGSEIIIDPD